MIIYVENFKLSIKKPNKGLQQGCKIKDQCVKSIVFLYTNNKQEEFNIKNTIPFTSAHHKMKFVHNLYV